MKPLKMTIEQLFAWLPAHNRQESRSIESETGLERGEKMDIYDFWTNNEKFFDLR